MPKAEELLDTRLSKISAKADQVERLLLTLNEAGLFTKRHNEDLRKQAHEKLTDARRAIEERNTIDSADHLLSASFAIHEAETRRKFWRLRNHQPVLFGYLIAVLAILLGIGAGWVPWISDTTVWTIPISMLGIGACGAVLRSLYWLYKKVAARTYRASYLLGHLASPMIGALLGMLVFLLIDGGLLMIEGQPEGTDGEGPSAFTHAMAFLAGLRWEWVLDWVKRFAARQGAAPAASRPTETASGVGDSDTPPRRDDHSPSGAGVEETKVSADAGTAASVGEGDVPASKPGDETRGKTKDTEHGAQSDPLADGERAG